MIDDRTPEQQLAQQQRAKEKLEPLNWVHLHGWIFMKNEKIYDLSAADLDRIEYIEQNCLFS